MHMLAWVPAGFEPGSTDVKGVKMSATQTEQGMMTSEQGISPLFSPLWAVLTIFKQPPLKLTLIWLSSYHFLPARMLFWTRSLQVLQYNLLNVSGYHLWGDVITAAELPSQTSPIRLAVTHIETRSAVRSFGQWITNQSWDNVFSDHSTDVTISNFLTEINDAFISCTFLSVSIRCSGKPWMTSQIKKVIALRQKAYAVNKLGFFTEKI